MVTHTIQQGDYVAQIALKYGFRSYLTIYNDGANAAFRVKRPNPDILAPGEQLAIPDHAARVEPAQTGKRHVFRTVSTTKVKLRLVVKDGSLAPLAGKPYTLRIGQELVGAAGDKKTGPDGLIELDVEPSITQVDLQVALDDADHTVLTWRLLIGQLDPITEVSGVKGRLNNLGFDCGPVNGTVDAPALRGLRAFRRAMGIVVPEPQEATIDPVTRDRIEREHGC